MKKTIKRRYYESFSDLTAKTGNFINTGIWADGHLAYSRVDDNGNIIPEEEGVYLQMRTQYGYFMQHI